MAESDDAGPTPLLAFEAWRGLLRSDCGGEVQVSAPNTFAGWMRPLSAYGLEGGSVNVQWGPAHPGCFDHRLERSFKDVRRDGADHYLVVFQVDGQSAMTQIDQTARLTVGDVALVDTARPVTHLSRLGNAQWLILRLPRKSVRSHLGFEPQGCVGRQGTRTSRVLFDLIRDADMEAASPSADIYMQFAIYDLVGALFGPGDPRRLSRSADKLFARICGAIRDGFADPDFGPVEVAAEVGVSLRYVQKLLTERDTTCGELIYSHRLDHAAQLLYRRALFGTGQPLNEIAFACGFRDYAHFARRFQRRFGHPPGAHAGQHSSDGAVRAGTAKSAFSARDVQFRTL
jgi:AraC family transcriptional activator of tynA and feaB